MSLMRQKYEIGSESDLIDMCRQGDMDGFRQIYALYKNRIWSIALHFVGNEAIAADITQQIFLKLFTSIEQFRAESKFSTWLYRITANACMDERRKYHKTASLDEMTENQAPEIMEMPVVKGSNQEELVINSETSNAVKQAIAQMKPKLRIAILLRYFEDLSYEEIGEILNCSAGTVASRLNRGHKELARRLKHLDVAIGNRQ